MFSDIIVRNKILAALPNLEPWRIEMEEIDYGDKMGLFYRSPNGVKRVAFNSKAESEDELAELFIAFIKREPRVIETKVEANDIIDHDLPNYEGRPGRHPDACICTRCMRKRNGQ